MDRDHIITEELIYRIKRSLESLCDENPKFHHLVDEVISILEVLTEATEPNLDNASRVRDLAVKGSAIFNFIAIKASVIEDQLYRADCPEI